jgi:hypothetical protein
MSIWAVLGIIGLLAVVGVIFVVAKFNNELNKWI